MKENIKLPKFDSLVAFYQYDPEAYEDFRKKMLEDEVAAAPPRLQAKLRTTLYNIEIARDKTKTPLEATIVACRMMFEATIQLRTGIKSLHYLTSSMQASLIIERAKKQSSKIKPRRENPDH